MSATLRKPFPSHLAGKAVLGTLLFIFCSLLGIGGAAFVFYQSSTLYQSNAKLLIRYVVDRSQADDWETTLNPARKEDRKLIVATEREILSSAELANRVVQSLGIERFVPSHKPEDAPIQDQAALVQRRLKVRFPEDSSVIDISFSDHDRMLTYEVLTAITKEYFEMHLRIHRSTGEYESLEKLTYESKFKLREAEEEFTKNRDRIENPFELKALERQLALFEKAYIQNQAKLEIARRDEFPNPERIPNIAYIQKPSAPVETHDIRSMGSVVALAVGGPLLGLILAFACRLVPARQGQALADQEP